MERGFRAYPVMSIASRRRRWTLKRSGYAEKSPLKGLFTSPLSGLPGFFHSRQVSTGGDRRPASSVSTGQRRVEVKVNTGRIADTPL
jgi:hypothetical protein